MTLTEQTTSNNEVILLDGGMGQELRQRRANAPTALWSAQALIECPEVVLEVHQDYIDAGATVITTNSYATVKKRLADTGNLADRFEELVKLAGELAVKARDSRAEPVKIAGSLPPLNGSYRPDRVQNYADIAPVYQQHVELLAPYVDVFLCETMSTAAEGFAAAQAATATGKPTWVAWTLADDASGKLRSGESLSDAWAVLSDLAIDAVLLNCCAPESITAAMPELVALGAPMAGGYANGFSAIPQGWVINKGVDQLGQREDFGPDDYAAFVQEWINSGARIVGGCCEVGPAHIARLRSLLG